MSIIARSLLPELMQIDKSLQLLGYNVENASNPFLQQQILREMHKILSYIVRHVVNEGCEKVIAQGGHVQMPPPPPPVASAQHVMQDAPLPVLGLPLHAAPAPLNPPGGSKVVEVSITPSGTTVKAPGAPQMVLPPGTNVDTTVLTSPQAPEGNVVLPQGGAMTPEVAHALAKATGGAQNVTGVIP